MGGDTTGLDKAIKGVNKSISATQSELRDVEKLLKLDPSNTVLLEQKQRLLASTISDTETKLNALKTAQQQLAAQADKSDLGRQQYDRLQREIIATEQKLDSLKQSAAGTETAMNDLPGANVQDFKKIENAAEETEESLDKLSKVDTSKIGSGLKTAGTAIGAGVAAIGAAATGMIAGINEITESTREYREDIGKLETAFTTAGISSEAATDTYKEFYSVLGEEDRSVEAVNHLAKLTTSEEDLSKWTDICAGVWGTFGDSLPIEGLTEAANETAKTGAVVGTLADALNWAGISEDDFNKKLEACSSEQERSALITNTLNGLYADAAENYRTANAEVIAAQKAQSELTDATAALGEELEPVSTLFKTFAADLLNSFLPGITLVSQGLQQAFNGDEGAAESLSSGIESLIMTVIGKLNEMMPLIINILSSLIPSLLNSLIQMLPQLGGLAIDLMLTLVNSILEQLPMLLQAAISIILYLAQALTNELPALIPAMISAILTMVETLLSPENLSNLIHAALQLILALVQGLVNALPELAESVPEIILTVISTIVSMLPEIVETGYTLIGELISGIISAAGNLRAKVMEMMNDLFEMLRSGELLDKAVEWGKDFIQGIIDGIMSMINNVKNAVMSVADKIKSFLHFSRPDEGPLRDYETWMPDFMNGLADGIYKNIPKVTKAASAVASSLDTTIMAQKPTNEFDYGKMSAAVKSGMSGFENPIVLEGRVIGRALKEMGVVFAK